MDESEVGADQVLIVVGADLRAEIADRPLAYHLRELIHQWQGQLAVEQAGEPVTAVELASTVVCTDMCYLNSPQLLASPAISIGDPGLNAASAYLANRLPTAMVLDGRFRVHLDPEFVDAQACIWGVNPRATADALDVFAERYLTDFLRAAVD